MSVRRAEIHGAGLCRMAVVVDEFGVGHEQRHQRGEGLIVGGPDRLGLQVQQKHAAAAYQPRELVLELSPCCGWILALFGPHKLVNGLAAQ